MTSRAAGRQRIKMSADEYSEAAESNAGVCLACGAMAYGVEPDACCYACEECGEKRVFGIEEALIMGRVEIG